MTLWAEAKLGDVCDLVGGGTPSKSNSTFYEGIIPWATVRDMRSELLSDTQYAISQDAVTESSTNIIKADNIVIATRVGLGKACILQQDTAINQDLKAVIPKDGRLTKPFLFQWLKSVSHVIQAAGTGATVQGVKLPFVKSLVIPLPPIPEQQRIIAILDQAFADIEKARANAEKNLKNARELFDSYLNQVVSQRGEGWVEYNLKDIVTLKGGTTVKKELEKTAGDIAYIKVSGMSLEGNEKEITTANTFLNGAEINSSNVLPVGTTIFPKRGGAIATNKKRITAIPLCIDLNTMGVIPKKAFILPLYLYFFFKTFDLLSISNGTTIPQINNYSFDDLKLSVPDIETQETLIKKLTQIETSTDDLSFKYEAKLNFLDELKKSLLQKAFSGELTKTEGMVA